MFAKNCLLSCAVCLISHLVGVFGEVKVATACCSRCALFVVALCSPRCAPSPRACLGCPSDPHPPLHCPVMHASASVAPPPSSVHRNLISSSASLAALEDPSTSRLLSDGGSAEGGAHLFRVLPHWQRVELLIVELMAASMEMQMRQAERNRNQREAKRREAEAAAAEIRPIVTAASKLEKYAPASHTAAATSSSAKTVKRPPAHNTATGTGGAAASLAASSSAAVAAAESSVSPSPSSSDSAAAAATEPDSPFLAHFHLLSHLLLELNVPTLERLISFLDPSPTPTHTGTGTNAAGAATNAHTTHSSAASTGSTGGGASSGMALCFRLLDSSTQVALVELLLKCVLQLKEMLDTAERRQHDEIEAAQRRRARERSQQEQEQAEERKHDEHAEGEVAPGEGKPASASAAAASSSSRPAAASTVAPSAASSPSRTPAVLAQQRLLHLLRWYSGLYRLSHILPRCLDYQNWLAAAVAIESRPAASIFAAMPMQGSLPPPAPRLNPVLLAAGALEDVNHTHLVDALECRLKHMEMRAESWRRWKRARRAYGASADAIDRPSCPSSLHDVPLLVDGLLPPLPADVWLSFDGYAIDTGKMLLQLVITHLVHIEAVSEQARLTALLMRAWREWDLPSLLLESIFLSNLLALAGGLCMLAFQKNRPASQPSQPLQSVLATPPSHNFSTDGSVVPASSAARGDAEASSSSSAAPSSSGSSGAASAGASAAPIFSAKLYLALTHYRLNAVYRANQSASIGGINGIGSSSVSSSSVSGGGSILSAPLSGSSISSGAPNLAQNHRLWSEILANLHRDLDGAQSQGAQSNSNSSYMIIRGASLPPPIIANSAAASSSASERLSLSADFAPPSSDSSSHSSNGSSLLLVSFSCGHVFPSAVFASVTLPQFSQALQSLSPPIPITAKFIMEEFQRLVIHSGNSGGSAGASSNGLSSSSNMASGGSGSSSAASASDTPGKCLAALSCPSCVFGALVSMHRKSESIRGATSAALVARQTSQALQASLASRAHLGHLEALSGGAFGADSGDVAGAAVAAAPGLVKSSSSLGQHSIHPPPSRSLTPGPNPSATAASTRSGSGDGTAGIRLGPGHRTTLSMMASSSATAASSAAPGSTPVSPPSSSTSHSQHPHPAPAGRHKFGLSMSGMIPKVMTFGRVSLADLESS